MIHLHKKRTLPSRSIPEAVIKEGVAIARIPRLLRNSMVETIDGQVIDMTVSSILARSERPGAVALALKIRRSLVDKGVVFTAPSKMREG